MQIVDDGIKLLCGDCLQVLPDIPDGSIDMVLCDLPFGVTGSEWDKPIPPARLWDQYRRVIGPDGAIVLFATEPFATKMRYPALDIYKYDWIWHKSTVTGFAHAKNMPLRDYENIMVFSKGSISHKGRANNRMHYNPQGIRDCRQIDYCHKDSLVMHSGTFKNTDAKTYIREKTGYPRMVLDFKKLPADSKFHLNAKPTGLLQYLIRTYTDKGQTVLDNAMGSGSTGVACINTGRKFIGIELDDHYFEVAQERIQSAMGGGDADDNT